ncbi:TPA: LCP family protein [Streptococcus suis]|nr:LCP family protein [Streptococcus suis]
MREKKSPLNHHEELRLDYLKKNIHYLNDKEQKELDYLVYKKTLREKHGLGGKPINIIDEQAPVMRIDQEGHSSNEPEPLLPKYPERKTRRAKKVTLQNPTLNFGKSTTPKKSHFGLFKKVIMTIIVIFGFLIVALGFNFIKGINSVNEKPVVEVFNGESTSNGINILILGTDGRIGESSEETRTDSIMVLNVNNSENKLKLVSFMRDTLIDINGYEFKLNAAYSIGEQDNKQGAEEVRKALKNNFGIDTQYYAMVDFATFATTIDTLFPEGVEIDAQFSTIDGETVSSVEVPNDIGFGDQSTPYQTIQVGRQYMNGQTLLNYARYRSDDEGDFGRTRRQQEVLTAVMTQAKNPMKLFSGAEAIGKVIAMTPTTIPQSFMWLQGPGIILDAANGIDRLTIPENGDWIDDYDMYGGMALRVDFEKYQQRLTELGLR